MNPIEVKSVASEIRVQDITPFDGSKVVRNMLKDVEDDELDEM